MATGDSLLFDGSDDRIVCSLGGVGVFGPGTFAAIVKPTAGSGFRWIADAGADHWAAGWNTSDQINLYNDAAHVAAVTITEDIWGLAAITKAAGTVAPRMHYYNGSGWTHTDAGSTAADSPTPSGDFKLSGDNVAGSLFAGNMLIAAYWDTVLSDGAIELLTNYQAWLDAAPLEGWRTDTLSAIASFGTTGTADETSRTGTSLDTGDVPSWWSEGESSELQQDFSWHFG